MGLCLREEEARAVIDSGRGICPRCSTTSNVVKLSVHSERRLFKKTTKLYCPSCNVFWEDLSSFEQEYDKACAKGLREQGLSAWIEEFKRQGSLPFEVPIILKKNEVPYLSWADVILYEGRRYTYRSTSLGTSVRVAKGFWIHPRVGRGDIQSEDVMRFIDAGSLTLTDKRLVFVGEKRTASVDLRKLIGVEVKDGLLYVAREGKQRIEAYEVPMPYLTKECILMACEESST